MPAITDTAQATFYFTGLAQFKQQLLLWASRSAVACYLDHNSYQGYAYHDFEALVAVGLESEIVSTDGQGAFDLLKKFQSEKQDWLFGFLTYDLKNEVEHLQSENFDGLGFPAVHFFQPRCVFEIFHDRVTISSRDVAPFKLFQEICSINPELPAKQFFIQKKLQPRIPKSKYLETVEAIRQHIRQGDIYEMNLCQEFYAEDCPIDPVAIFGQLNELSKAPFSAFYKLNDRYLLCASPERFLKKRGDKLISQPIKGTVRRDGSPQADALLRQQLFHSAKDRSENVMIVDLVRNDLSRSCRAGSVKVEELYGTYSFEQVHQLISTVTGTLRQEVHFIDAIRRAFPMGSMTGAPKVRSMQLIEHYESTKRGLYSGAVGYITPGGDFDFNVVIRSILYNHLDRYLSVQVGGAIVYGSDPLAEYAECLLKAKGMFSVLGTG